MNARAALQNGARASAIKPNNKGHSKNSRAEAGKGTYTQFEPARTHTQLYNLKSDCRHAPGVDVPGVDARGRALTRPPACPRSARGRDSLAARVSRVRHSL